MHKYGWVALALLLTACAKPKVDWEWYRNSSTNEEFDREAGQCKAQGFAVSAGENYHTRAARVYMECMQGKGWKRVPK